MGAGRTCALAAVLAVALVMPPPQAHAAPQVERFRVVALSGTQSSDVTLRLADEAAGTTCMRATTENVSFALPEPAVVYVSKRARGKRSVWSVAERPTGLFEVVDLPTVAGVARNTTSRGPCPEADCSAEATVPWTVQLTGARLSAAGANVGARPFAETGLESCPYDGVRALRPNAAADLLDPKELFDRDARRITTTEGFDFFEALPDGSTSSQVEITATLRRLGGT